jgi:hypothetical protein
MRFGGSPSSPWEVDVLTPTALEALTTTSSPLNTIPPAVYPRRWFGCHEESFRDFNATETSRFQDITELGTESSGESFRPEETPPVGSLSTEPCDVVTASDSTHDEPQPRLSQAPFPSSVRYFCLYTSVALTRLGDVST